MKGLHRIVLAVCRFIITAPLYVVWGVWIAVRSVVKSIRWFRRAHASLSDTLVCRNGHRNAVVGRYECHRCHAITHGWLGDACPICGAHASWISCEQCGVAIRFPWDR